MRSSWFNDNAYAEITYALVRGAEFLRRAHAKEVRIEMLSLSRATT